MKVTIVQSSLIWENRAENRRRFSEKIKTLAGQTDLIVLPEMFTTGFSMNPEHLAEEMTGETVDWIQVEAKNSGAAIVGSFICREKGKHFNRLVFAQSDGQIFSCDKRHLFSLAGEQNHYEAGNEQLVVFYKGLRIRLLTCYDLRFPVWSRNVLGKNEYDVLVYAANWPMPRIHHWTALLQARAIENQAFTVGVNIVGTDGNGLEYNGESAMIDHSGRVVCRLIGLEGVFTAEISGEEIQEWRSKFPFLKDADRFQLPDLI